MSSFTRIIFPRKILLTPHRGEEKKRKKNHQEKGESVSQRKAQTKVLHKCSTGRSNNSYE